MKQAILLGTLLAGLVAPVYATSLLDLGDLPGGDYSCRPFGISADGTMVVGNSSSADLPIEAFHWTEESGIVGFARFQSRDTRSHALGVSRDGSAFAVQGQFDDPHGSSIWTGYRYEDGWLLTVGDYASPTCISDDGTTIAGSYYGNVGNKPEAFSWSSPAGRVALGTLPGDDFSLARQVSADGSTVIGYSSDATGNRFSGFLWTSNSGMVDLGGWSTGFAYSIANDITLNGTNIVGAVYAGRFGPGKAATWSSATGWTPLASSWATFDSRAIAVSDDGSVIVGVGYSAPGVGDTFIWDATNGMRRLTDVLTAAGTNVTGWVFSEPVGISADGRTITGFGRSPANQDVGWLVRLGFDATNQPPVANAGADIVAPVGTRVTFNGSASSDPDGTIVSYNWDTGLTGATPGRFYSATGSYVVALTVTDNMGATNRDTVSVRIKDYSSVYTGMFFRCSVNAWSPSKMLCRADFTWVVDVALYGGEAFKFDVSGNWSTAFGDTNKDGIAESPGINITNTQGVGAFRVTFNDKTKAYKLIRKSSFPKMAITGTHNGWNLGGPAMTLIAPFTWVIEHTFTTNGSIKFTPWSTTWAGVFGDNDSNGIADQMGGSKNIPVSQGPGKYKITFNDLTLAYKVELSGADTDSDGLPDAWEQQYFGSLAQTGTGDPDGDGKSNKTEYLAGFDPMTPGFLSNFVDVGVPGTFNGWNVGATKMSLVADYTWRNDGVALNITDAQFKFVGNNAWSNNWGESNQSAFILPMSATAEAGNSSGNIRINEMLAGTFRFSFNEQTLSYSVQPAP